LFERNEIFVGKPPLSLADDRTRNQAEAARACVRFNAVTGHNGHGSLQWDVNVALKR